MCQRQGREAERRDLIPRRRRGLNRVLKSVRHEVANEYNSNSPGTRSQRPKQG